MKIPKKESLTVEFKSDKKGYPDKSLVEEVVGMTNTKGGDLFLGVEDDGTVSGIKPHHKDSPGVNAMIRSRTVPSLNVESRILNSGGLSVLLIEIPMSHQIIATSDGKILKRQLKADGSPENVPLFPFEMETRLSDLNKLDFTAQPLFEASIEDFDPLEITRLRNLIEKYNGDPSLLSLSDESLFLALGMVKEINGNLIPTYAGLLLVGKQERIRELIPTAESAFQILDGRIVKKNDYTFKPILAVLEEYMGIFQSENREAEIEDGLQRVPIPDYSPSAFREAVVNAFVHRDYTLLRPVLITMNNEGITISSPGGFIHTVTLENILHVSPGGRNPLLADALKRIGLTERTGRGIDRIFEGSILYGRPIPDYSESSSAEVKLLIPKAAPDLAFFSMLRSRNYHWQNALSINSLMILHFLQETPLGLSAAKLADLLHISKTRVSVAIEELQQNELIRKDGSLYRLNPALYHPTAATNANTEETEDKIFELLKRQASVSRKEAAQFLNLSTSQAYRILSKMVKDGKLIRTGSGSSTAYRLIRN